VTRTPLSRSKGHSKVKITGGEGILWRPRAQLVTFVMVQGFAAVEHRQDEERPGDAERHDPDGRDLDDGQALVADVAEAQREVERHVAVDRDHAQVADRRRREENVQTVPGEAQQLRDRQAVCTHATTRTTSGRINDNGNSFIHSFIHSYRNRFT